MIEPEKFKDHSWDAVCSVDPKTDQRVAVAHVPISAKISANQDTAPFDAEKIITIKYIISNPSRPKFLISPMEHPTRLGVFQSLGIGLKVLFFNATPWLIKTGLMREVLLQPAPGFGMRDFLGHFCQKKFRENVLEAIHAEALYDYQEALAKKDFVRAKYVGRMIYFWMLSTMLKGAIGWVTTKFSMKLGSND
jgi:hypothetical protein